MFTLIFGYDQKRITVKCQNNWNYSTKAAWLCPILRSFWLLVTEQTFLAQKKILKIPISYWTYSKNKIRNVETHNCWSHLSNNEHTSLCTSKWVIIKNYESSKMKLLDKRCSNALKKIFYAKNIFCEIVSFRN